MLDLSRIPDFSFDLPSAGPSLNRAYGHAMAEMHPARQQIIAALDDVIRAVALAHCRALHRLGNDPAATAGRYFDGLSAGLASLGDTALTLTNADECPGGPFDGNLWGQVEMGVVAAIREQLSPTDNGDYTESNRLTAGDVVSTGRAA